MSKDLNADVRPNFAHISDPHDETPYAQSALTPAANFNPNAKIAEQILSDVSNPLICLHTIAVKAQTTVEAIHLWLARPDIAQRFEAIESTLRRRARINVLHNVNAVTETCATIMERFYRAPDRGPIDDRDPRTHLIRARNASNALMASRVLIFTSRYLDGPPPSSHRTQHAPRPTPPRPDPHTPIADSTAHTSATIVSTTTNTLASADATTNATTDTASTLSPPNPSSFRILPPLPNLNFNDENTIPRASLTKPEPEPLPDPQPANVPPTTALSARCTLANAPETQTPSPQNQTSVLSVPSVPSDLPPPQPTTPRASTPNPQKHKKQKHKPPHPKPNRSRNPTIP